MREKRPKRPRDPAQLAKLIIDIASGEVEDRDQTPEEQGKDAAAVALGRLGGKARARSMSPEQRSKIAKRAARARVLQIEVMPCGWAGWARRISVALTGWLSSDGHARPSPTCYGPLPRFIYAASNYDPFGADCRAHQ